MIEIQYINKKGYAVKVEISLHARTRFIERYNKIFPEAQLSGKKLDDALLKWWGHAEPKVNRSRKMETRRKRYGKDTLFFVSSYFTFVVQSNMLITVELSSRGTRHLNKIDGPSPIKHKPKKSTVVEERENENA